MKNKQSNDFLKEEPTGSIVKQSGMSDHIQQQEGSMDFDEEDRQDTVVINPSEKEKRKSQFNDDMDYEYKQQHGSSKYGFGRQYDAAKFKREMLEFSNNYFVNFHRDRVIDMMN